MATAGALHVMSPARSGWWTFDIQQPLRVESGTLRYRLANPYQNWDDPQSWDNREIRLSPSGRELRFSLGRDWSYWAPRQRGAWLGLQLENALERGHNVDAPPETFIKLNGGARF